MLVYLVRHGDAKPEEVDPERPLSDRGWAEVERVARHLGRLRLPLAEICHSDRLRARQTADLLAKHLLPALGTRAARGLGPMDDPALVREDLDAFPGPLMLVGHLPHLDRLARSLLQTNGALFAFPPAAVLCLVRADTGWRVDWLLTPQLAPPAD